MPASSKEFLDIQANIECGLTLNRVRDMIRTYNQLELIRFLGGLLDGNLSRKEQIKDNENKIAKN